MQYQTFFYQILSFFTKSLLIAYTTTSFYLLTNPSPVPSIGTKIVIVVCCKLYPPETKINSSSVILADQTGRPLSKRGRATIVQKVGNDSAVSGGVMSHPHPSVVTWYGFLTNKIMHIINGNYTSQQNDQ